MQAGKGEKSTKFQRRMSFASIILMFVLMIAISGNAFVHNEYRMIWLGAFLAIALHFIPFSLVHGKSMLVLAIPLTMNALAGIYNPQVPFLDLAYIDASIKLVFGVVLLFSKKPVSAHAVQQVSM